jgi:UPF0176 protein
MSYIVTTFYIFTPLAQERLLALKSELESEAKAKGIVGLMLIAEEGANATLAGEAANLAEYKQFLTGTFGELMFKDSPSDRLPFKRFKVKIKPEIVQLDRPGLVPTCSEVHLSSEEWNELMADTDAIVIDVRNWYEVKLGSFKNAINPKTWKFSQFPAWLASSGIPTDKKIGIFCTGGIRCEKAAVAMKEAGYENVQQLDGGILKYIEEKPNQNFAGECFVFDSRCAVGQDLQPSRAYSTCVGCGNGADQNAICEFCAKDYRICADCQAGRTGSFCSKDCRYRHHLRQERMAV